jgi:hypothetical protein
LIQIPSVIIHDAGRRGDQMPHTREQLGKAAAEAKQWLDNLDPDDPSVTVEDAADLRAVGLAGSQPFRPQRRTWPRRWP